MLTVSELGHRLPDGRELFSGVSLQLHPGDAFAICGPSGIGKTTLLWLIGQQLTPASGCVRVDAHHPRPFAWVLQGLNALPARSVTANVMLCGTIDGEPSQLNQSRSVEALEAVGLGALAKARMSSLSGGELQRVTVARAISSTRPILLADEPTSQLDRPNARRVMALLESESERGRAVVIVTHDVESLSRKVVRLRLTPTGLVA